MSRSDADHLEVLKIARDAIADGIAAGRLTIEYEVRGKKHTVTDPVKALENIEGSIEAYESKTARRSRSPFRGAQLRRPR
jgi:hypothetical protein